MRNHLAVELCWNFYQRMIAAYAHPDRRRGKAMMGAVIYARSGVPDVLEELAQLGRTLWRHRADILSYFDFHASNGPTEAINGPTRSTTPQRPRLQKPHPLPTALTAAVQ